MCPISDPINKNKGLILNMNELEMNARKRLELPHWLMKRYISTTTLLGNQQRNLNLSGQQRIDDQLRSNKRYH